MLMAVCWLVSRSVGRCVIISEECSKVTLPCSYRHLLVYGPCQEHDYKSLLNVLQKSCITYVVQTKPQEVYVPESQTGIRFHIWRLVTSPPFENFIMLLIILNTILLMCKVDYL